MTDLTASSLRALKLMDLTTLNDDDTNEKVIALCHQAKTPVGNTAAICIYPRFIPLFFVKIKLRLDKRHIKILGN